MISTKTREKQVACLEALLLSLGRLVDEGLVDMRDNTTTGDGGLDEGVKFLVTTNGELKMAGSDTLHLEILAGVASELEDLGGEVLKDGGRVDSRSGADTLGILDGSLEETVHTTDRELLQRAGQFKQEQVTAVMMSNDQGFHVTLGAKCDSYIKCSGDRY